MNKQPSYLIPILICCVYPIVAPLVTSWLWRWLTRRDWKNIDLASLWRKEE